MTNGYFNAKCNYTWYGYIMFLLFPTFRICTRLLKIFGRTKYYAVNAAKTYSMIASLLGVLQPFFFKPFPKFVNYNKHRNTYEYI